MNAPKFDRIVSDGTGRMFRTRDAGPGLEHCYLAVELNRRNYQPKKNAREHLLRRMGTTIVVPYLEPTV